MKRNQWIAAFLAFASLWPVTGSARQTTICPDEPNQVMPAVYVDVRRDAATGLYNYNYVVRNNSGSKQAIESFAVETIESVSNLHAPKGWVASIGSAGRPVVIWNAADVANPDLVPDDASVPPSVVQIKPGSSLAGFGFKSAKPPGQVRYFATGYVPPLPPEVFAHYADEEEDEGDCPGLQLQALDRAFVSRSRGPVDVTANLVLDVQGPNLGPASAAEAIYRVSVTNEGSGAAKRPRLAISGNTLPDPSENTMMDSTEMIPGAAGWRCRDWPRFRPGPSTIVCDRAGDLAPNERAEFTLKTPIGSARSEHAMTIQGTVTSSTPDTNPDDNRAGSTVPMP